MGGLGGVDWAKLSNIGQTYGAASAVLSALAVGGVAISLFLQANQGRANQVQMVREYQRELVRMLLDDPDLYLPCWRPYDLPGLDINAKRQNLFSMLRMNYRFTTSLAQHLPVPCEAANQQAAMPMIVRGRQRSGLAIAPM